MRRSFFVSVCVLAAWLGAEPAAAPASVMVIGNNPGRGAAHEVAGNLTDAYRDYKRAQELAPRWHRPGEELSRFQVTRVSKQKM